MQSARPRERSIGDRQRHFSQMLLTILQLSAYDLEGVASAGTAYATVVLHMEQLAGTPKDKPGYNVITEPSTVHVC